MINVVFRCLKRIVLKLKNINQNVKHFSVFVVKQI